MLARARRFVCVREKKREKERGKEKESKRERERERLGCECSLAILKPVCMRTGACAEVCECVYVCV